MSLIIRRKAGLTYVVDQRTDKIVYHSKNVLDCIDYVNRANLAYEIAKKPTLH